MLSLFLDRVCFIVNALANLVHSVIQPIQTVWTSWTGRTGLVLVLALQKHRADDDSAFKGRA